MVEEIFEKVDINKDGAIEYTEFLAASIDKESLLSASAETIFEVTAEEHEITLDAFAIDPGYVVLDEEGIKRLYQQAQSDPQKKIQWEEFQQVFGNK